MFILQDPETTFFFLWLFRCLSLVLVVWAAWSDWRTFDLPLPLTVPAAMVAVSGEGLFGAGWAVALAGAFAGFAVLKTAQILARLRHKKECLGTGDAILMLSLGALLGVQALPWALALAVLAVVIAAKLCRKTKSEKIPFGPFLVGASLPVGLIQWVV